MLLIKFYFHFLIDSFLKIEICESLVQNYENNLDFSKWMIRFLLAIEVLWNTCWIGSRVKWQPGANIFIQLSLLLQLLHNQFTLRQ